MKKTCKICGHKYRRIKQKNKWSLKCQESICHNCKAVN